MTVAFMTLHLAYNANKVIVFKLKMYKFSGVASSYMALPQSSALLKKCSRKSSMMNCSWSQASLDE